MTTTLNDQDRAELTDITSKFQTAHKNAKRHETDKGKHKGSFFSKINDLLSKTNRSKKIVDIQGVSEDRLESWVEEFHPGWVLDSFDVDRTGEPLEAQLIEDPEYMEYAFVNQDNEMVYSRSIRDGSPSVDDKKLREADWDLYLEVTENSQVEDVLLEFVAILSENYELEDLTDDVVEFIFKKIESNEIVRPLRAIEKLTKTQIEEVRDYLIPGRKSAVMQAPRKAKPEELN